VNVIADTPVTRSAWSRSGQLARIGDLITPEEESERESEWEEEAEEERERGEEGGEGEGG